MANMGNADVNLQESGQGRSSCQVDFWYQDFYVMSNGHVESTDPQELESALARADLWNSMSYNKEMEFRDIMGETEAESVGAKAATLTLWREGLNVQCDALEKASILVERHSEDLQATIDFYSSHVGRRRPELRTTIETMQKELEARMSFQVCRLGADFDNRLNLLGTDRGCSGSSHVTWNSATLYECMQLCLEDPDCEGVQYREEGSGTSSQCGIYMSQAPILHQVSGAWPGYSCYAKENIYELSGLDASIVEGFSDVNEGEWSGGNQRNILPWSSGSAF